VKRTGQILLTALLLGACQPSALACATCYGKSDSNLAQGMNAGIFVLLLVVTGVLGRDRLVFHLSGAPGGDVF